MDNWTENFCEEENNLVAYNWQKQPTEVFCKKRCYNFIKKETLTQVFSCEFCEISKNTFFTEHVWATAFELVYARQITRATAGGIKNSRQFSECHTISLIEPLTAPQSVKVLVRLFKKIDATAMVMQLMLFHLVHLDINS